MKKFLFAFCIVCSCFVVVSCATANNNKSTVTVSGSGSVDLKSDVATFSVYVSEIAETTKEAQNETNKKIAAVLEILKEFGISDDDIKTTSLNLSTSYNWIDGKQVREGERASHTISVKIRNLDYFGELLDNLGSVSGISVSSVSFDAENKTDALADARRFAYEDAFIKAKAYCDASGMQIVQPISINETYSTYNARTSGANDMVMLKATAYAEDAGYGTEISAGTKTVKVETECVFEIKK